MNEKIVICLPGDNFSGRFLDCLLDLMYNFMQSGVSIRVSRRESPIVYYARNMCLGADIIRGEYQKPFDGKLDYTHLLWLDSDIIFGYEHVQSLLKHNKDIVSGIYMMSNNMHFATVKKIDNENFLKNQGSYDFLTLEDIKSEKDLIDVSYTGFGFILIKKGVFESITYPWFRPIFHKIGNCYDFASEDASVCELFRDKGFKIWVDPTIRVGHEKKIVL